MSDKRQGDLQIGDQIRMTQEDITATDKRSVIYAEVRIVNSQWSFTAKIKGSRNGNDFQYDEWDIEILSRKVVLPTRTFAVVQLVEGESWLLATNGYWVSSVPSGGSRSNDEMEKVASKFRAVKVLFAGVDDD